MVLVDLPFTASKIIVLDGKREVLLLPTTVFCIRSFLLESESSVVGLNVTTRMIGNHAGLLKIRTVSLASGIRKGNL